MLNSKTVTHEYTTDEIKKLFAAELKVPPAAITVNYVISDIGFEYGGSFHKDVTAVRVIVDNRKVDK